MTRVLALILVLAGSARAQITGIRATVTNTQAVIEYNYTSPDVCSIEVSESATYLPLVLDLDPVRFPGSNLDNRMGSVKSGTLRTVVVGKRATERGADGIPYSRALQNATVHYFRITCASSVSTGTFATAAIPFGATYTDPIPADPQSPGEALWPQLDYSDRSKTYVDPQTGVLLKRLTGPADIYELGLNYDYAAWPAATIAKAPGSAWRGSAFPYSVTNATDPLLALASGLHGWGSYPYGPTWSAFYYSDATAELNWLTVRITANTSNGACNSNSTDNCQLTLCLSTDRATCHPLARQIDIPLTTTATARVVGSAGYVDQGGWIRAGNRWLSGPETTDYAGGVICDGSATVRAAFTFNPGWGSGSVITINGTDHQIVAMVHEGLVTLAENCPAGTWQATGTNFAILIRPKVVSADTITISNLENQWEYGVPPQWGAAAYWDYTSATPVNGANGIPGYMAMLPTLQGVYWINTATGDSRLLTQDLLINTVCLGFSQVFDVNNPAKWNCVAANGVITLEYKGEFSDRLSIPAAPSTGFRFNSPNRLSACNNPVSPTNQPCVIQTDLSQGIAVTSLLHAYDPAYDPTKYSSIFPIGMNQDGRIVLLHYRGQENSTAWISVFDPNLTANGEPGNAGCFSAAANDRIRKGCIVAALPTWLRGAGRGQPLKGDILPNVAAGWLRYSPMIWYGAALDGMGYWQMNTMGGFTFNTNVAAGNGLNEVPGGLNACPSNAFGITGKLCTEVTVTGDPYDPNPGPTETGAPGEYIVAQAGDWLYVNGGGQSSTEWEMLRVVAKNGLTLTVARAQTRGAEACVDSVADCAAGSLAPLNSTASPVLNYAASAPTIYWNYAADPHGLNGGSYDNKFIGRNHSSGRFTGQVDAINPGDDKRCVTPGGCYGLTYLDSSRNSVLEMLNTPRTGFATANPPFAGKIPFAIPNNIQIHPSQMGQSGRPDEKEYFLDGRPFNGIYSSVDPAQQQATNVSGQLWKFSSSGGNALHLNRKFLPTKAQIGWRPLLDVSGPSSLIGTGPPDNYKYCVVEAAGECFGGSVKGEVYFNTPRLRLNYCAFPGQAGSVGPDTTDVCILDQAMIHDSLLQLRMSGPSDLTGATQRLLTKGFAVSRMNAPFGNIQALADNRWALFRTRFLRGFRSEAMLMKLPPVSRFESINRGDFEVFTLALSEPPPGTATVVAEFGYAENGPSNNLYCTSRSEACAVGRATAADQIDPNAPFYFVNTESSLLSGTPCATGCRFAIPGIPARVLYYRIRYRDVSRSTLFVTGIRTATLY